ncbi:MAG: phage GP46 family protein [Candidatus Omnitrophica bacterium]|nr:phage GP46 family protein [Candidatus Omnitrophota bacterium]
MSDVLLVSTNDGGDIICENGIIEMTAGFETAVFISLHAGNLKDDGTQATKKYTWWGNLLEDNNPDGKIISRFQNILSGLPATPENLIKAKQAAMQDLEWLTSTGISDKIEISATIPAQNRIAVEINILKDGAKLYGTTFELNWKGMTA